jgi:tetratricopeptide (TPR) repeat protein
LRQHIPDIFFTKELFIVVISLLFSYVLRAQPKEETLKLARAGYDLEQQGKLSEALFKYNQCIAADPKYPYPVQRIASMYHKLKNYPKAVQFYQRAIALDSSFDDYNYSHVR